MLSLFKTDIIYRLDDLPSAVAKQIRLIPQLVSPEGDVRGLLRFEFKCEPLDGFTWLHNQKTNKKIYWRNRNNAFTVAGIGIADEVISENYAHIHDIFEIMEDNLSAENPNQRYYGGISFQPQIHSREWQAYHSIHFLIPQFEILNIGDQTIFAFNIALKDINHDFIEQSLSNLAAINFTNTTSYRDVPQKLDRCDHPNKTQWTKIFDRLRTTEQTYKFKKIVLARQSQFTFDIPIKPDALLKHLAAITPNCYHFDFQIDTYRGFIGATPEQLFSLEEDTLTTEALAGSINRGQNKEHDHKLGEQLLACPKTAIEHNYVVETIDTQLRPLCEQLSCDQKQKLKKLRNNQHLLTEFSGTVKNNINAADILKALHPTPAVGGVPHEDILEAIRSIEPFDRGWYAAPVGYIGYNKTEFAVAIRSALIDNSALSLYAGAGVVAGSTPEKEWDEIETKIGNFLKVFSQ